MHKKNKLLNALSLLQLLLKRPAIFLRYTITNCLCYANVHVFVHKDKQNFEKSPIARRPLFSKKETRKGNRLIAKIALLCN